MAQGFNTGGGQKGTPNKLTLEVKQRIKRVLEDALDSLDLEQCSNAERIKLIEIGLKYLLPTMRRIESQHPANFNCNDFKSVLRFED
jgi:hypothetical protein